MLLTALCVGDVKLSEVGGGELTLELPAMPEGAESPQHTVSPQSSLFLQTWTSAIDDLFAAVDPPPKKEGGNIAQASYLRPNYR